MQFRDISKSTIAFILLNSAAILQLTMAAPAGSGLPASTSHGGNAFSTGGYAARYHSHDGLRNRYRRLGQWAAMPEVTESGPRVEVDDAMPVPEIGDESEELYEGLETDEDVAPAPGPVESTDEDVPAPAPGPSSDGLLSYDLCLKVAEQCCQNPQEYCACPPGVVNGMDRREVFEACADIPEFTEEKSGRCGCKTVWHFLGKYNRVGSADGPIYASYSGMGMDMRR